MILSNHDPSNLSWVFQSTVSIAHATLQYHSVNTELGIHQWKDSGFKDTYRISLYPL